METLDLQVTYVDAIDLNELPLIHTLIEDEIVPRHIYIYKMESKNENQFQINNVFFFFF